MKTKLAYYTGRLSKKLLKIVNRGGSLPGQIALKFDPNLMKKFKYPKKVILVTATNGKTTTTNMIVKTLQENNQKVASNHKGDNLIIGILSTLLENSNANLVVQADALVLEIDEHTLARYLPIIPATHIVIMNLFRDQLDRSGEMESLIHKLSNTLSDYQGKLILNADDPNVNRLALQTKVQTVFFSMDKTKYSVESLDEASEGKFCPKCWRLLKYDFYHYSHIGKYHCECGYQNFEANYFMNKIDFEQNQFYVNHELYHCKNMQIYHLYNCLACISVCHELQVNPSIIDKVVHTFQLSLGRGETINNTQLHLVKNPTGCNEIIKSLKKDKNAKAILFILNDNAEDGRDVSWIWDANFEALQNVDLIICSGLRAYDGALRFKYGEIGKNIIVEEDITKAVNYFQKVDKQRYVLATYTSLVKTRKELYKCK